ncbi:Recombinational DNA repair protein RecT [Nostoc flagelliforme CCNUN1]|uniref:Recombinational DNA repair protein RecT n=1 Tax=Nostoc flagelliforme CCNUN1 TaxID=2038116 RepID=A0A2K8SRM6_9NOSO|nr:ERF family protein [Nostoc flagelliforme]AUB37465.1 Recombinational DNA repair protein RecT [Nostoc flagelliforme CCNUN1]
MTPQLNLALAKAKAQFPAILANRNVKIPTKAGREINFTYAELEEIAQAVTPTLSSNGLVIVHQMQFVENKFCLVSTLRHESGEQIESFYPLPAGFNDAKELGIQITYGRRYNTICLLDITAVNSHNWEETKRYLAREIKQEAGFIEKPSNNRDSLVLPNPTRVNTVERISEPQIRNLWAIARGELKLKDDVTKNVILGFGCQSSQEITTDRYEAIIKELRQSAKQTLSPAATK